MYVQATTIVNDFTIKKSTFLRGTFSHSFEPWSGSWKRVVMCDIMRCQDLWCEKAKTTRTFNSLSARRCFPRKSYSPDGKGRRNLTGKCGNNTQNFSLPGTSARPERAAGPSSPTEPALLRRKCDISPVWVLDEINGLVERMAAWRIVVNQLCCSCCSHIKVSFLALWKYVRNSCPCLQP